VACYLDPLERARISRVGTGSSTALNGTYALGRVRENARLRTAQDASRRRMYPWVMAKRADDLAADPAVALIEEPSESFDAWLDELLGDPPVELETTGADLVAQARADEA
jgi:hypothetical protein